jgi:c-di-GMP-related signal transduction protein
MASLLESIALSQETKAVLLGEANRLRPLYLLVQALESGDWQSANALTKQLHLTEKDVAEKYWQAMKWAREVKGA